MAAFGYCCPVPGNNTDEPGFRVYRRAVAFLGDYLERHELCLTLNRFKYQAVKRFGHGVMNFDRRPL